MVRRLARLTVGMGLWLAALGANAQSINVDIDIFAGPPEGGNGAPSASFGAAANQPGFWNRLDAASHTRPWSLQGLDGNATGVQVVWNVSGGGGGSGWIGNTGSHRLLMNDYTRISVPTTFRFSGLRAGLYRIFTYACDPSDFVIPVEITVPGAIAPIQYSGQAAMPANRFEVGITHTSHEINLAGTTMEIVLRDPQTGPPGPSVNGFQLVLVPESGFLVLPVGLLALVSFRKRRAKAKAPVMEENQHENQTFLRPCDVPSDHRALPSAG